MWGRSGKALAQAIARWPAWLPTCCLLACCLQAQAQAQAAAPPAPLRVGVLPYLSPRTLLLQFAPLRLYLAQELRQPVEVGTAADLARFVARSHGGDFELVVTAPHFARLAQLEHGFVPLIAIRADFYALVLVPQESPAQNLRELRGEALHLPNRLSFTAQRVEDFLQQRGVDTRYDLRSYYYSTDNNAVLALAHSRNGAAAAQRAVFESMPAEITAGLRILGSTQSALSLVVLAAPSLPPARRAAISAALERFPYTEAGLAFFKTLHGEFVPADAATMRQLDPYQERLSVRLRESH